MTAEFFPNAVFRCRGHDGVGGLGDIAHLGSSALACVPPLISLPSVLSISTLSAPTTGRCGDSNIYIAGDVNAHLPLPHTASRQGKTGGSNAGRHPDTQASPEYAGLSVTFCDPQIATAGQSFKTLTDSGIEFASGEIDWSNQGRSTVMLVNQRISRIYGDMATGRLLGVEMIGSAAEHMAHLVTWEIESGAKVTDLFSRPFYHPCIEEGLRTALCKLAHRMGRTNEEPVPRCLDCGPES